MDKDLVHGDLGTVGKYDLAFADGKLVVTASVVVPEATMSLSVAISPKSLLDAIAVKVGGPIPLEVAAFIEAALQLK